MHNIIGVGVFLFLLFCQDNTEMNKFGAGLIVVLMLLAIGAIAKRL